MKHRTSRSGGRLAVSALVTAVVMLSAPSDAGYLRPGRIERVSVTSSGGETINAPIELDSSGVNTAINANGRFVAFESMATNLVAGDANGVADIFVHDRQTRKTEIVSVSSTGAIATTAVGACATGSFNGNIGSFTPAISANGRYVAFHSCATNLVPGDTNLASDVFLHDRHSKKTQRVSVGRNGVQAGGRETGLRSAAASLSPDARFVGFASTATNLVKNDSNGFQDVFLRDRKLGKTERISVGSQQQQGNADSGCSSISRSGRFVAFSSNTSNLGSDTDESVGYTDGFVRDRKTRKTEWISPPVAPSPGLSGGASPCGSGAQSISADGRFVLLSSDARALIPSDQNGRFDAFVYDRAMDRMMRVSVGSDGSEPGPQNSGIGSITPDGRFVTFWSAVAFFPQDSGDIPSNTIPPSPQGDEDVFVYDLRTKAVDWVSLTSDNKQPTGCELDGLAPGTGTPGLAKYPAISASGRYVAFESCATNLVEKDTNRTLDTFVRDRGNDLAVGRLSATATVGPQGRGAPSSIMKLPDERGDVFEALPSGDIVGAQLILRPFLGDALAWIDVDRLPPILPGTGLSANALTYGLRFDVDGIAYELRATPTAATPLTPSYGLYRCDGTSGCMHVRDLHGSYGTTGHTVAISVPLAEVGLRGGGRVSEVEAFTALVDRTVPDLTIVDRALARG